MTPRRFQLTAGVVLIALAAACGDDDSTNGASSSPTTAQAGDPILVGFVNSDGGSPVDVPEVRYGAAAAVRYINTELGGLNGRPIELLRCDVDGSPERSIDCANRFVESGVAWVQTGLDYASGAMLPILESANIPMIGGFPFSPEVTASPNAFFFAAGAQTIATGPLQFFADEGHRRIAMFMPDVPQNQAFSSSLLEPAGQALGLDYRTIFYTPGTPDWNALVATAMAGEPDVIGNLGGGEAVCTAFVSAVRSAGYDGTVYNSGQCSDFIAELGDQSAGVTVISTHWRPDAPEEAPPGKREEVELYLEAMAADGHDGELSSYAVSGFSVAFDIARMLSDIDDPIDGPAIRSVLSQTQDFDTFMGPVISCDGSVTPGQNVCSNAMLFWEIEEGGTLRALTDDFVHVDGLAG